MARSGERFGAPMTGIPLALNATISVYYQRIRPVLSHGNVLPFVLPFATSTGGE